MALIIVGIGEFATSNTQGDILKTIALGSCVGIVALAPQQRAVGLLHVALPSSDINQDLAIQRPGFFADTGVRILLNQLTGYGCTNNQIYIKLAGGANIMDPNNTFNIGWRNLTTIKMLLGNYCLNVVAEDVGDYFSRTVTVAVDTGKVIITSPGREDKEL